MLGSKTTLAVVRELSWGILGRGEGGLKGIGVSGSGYNEVPALGMLNVVDYVERGRCVSEASRVCTSSSPCHCSAVVPGVLACVHAYIHMRVCVDVYAYICAGVHVCVYMHMRVRPCTRTCALHAHACARVCADGGS